MKLPLFSRLFRAAGLLGGQLLASADDNCRRSELQALLKDLR